MDSGNSIIDRILTSKQTEAMEHLSPSETVSQLLKALTEKEADVVRRRYGLNGLRRETLEDIGKQYRVTRERIRQIERLAIKKVVALKDFDVITRPTTTAVSQVLSSHGGFLEEQALLRTLLQIAGDTPENCNAMLFLLHELLGEHFDHIDANRRYHAGWRMRLSSMEQLDTLVNRLVAFFENVGHPLAHDEFIHRFRGVEGQAAVSDDALLAAVDVAIALGHNPFGEYGLTEWGHIAPRRMNDKIFLVLKRAGEPLHFMEIAKRINEAGFDDRKAYPPTVHNELILDPHYVLVGRGIYALKEWGYEPGIVADVLASVLRRAGRPLERDELVEAVLKQRMVKRNTIHLALTDRERFSRHQNGTYTLTDRQTNATPTARH